MKIKNNDSFKITGSVDIKLYDAQGNLKQEHIDHNLVVTAGKNYLAEWLITATQSSYFMQYIGVGTGTTGPLITDTDLETPLPTRVAGTLTRSTNVWQNSATFSPGVNTGAVTEAGLFSDSSGGTMFARQVFSVFNKEAGDTLVVTWQVTFS